MRSAGEMAIFWDVQLGTSLTQNFESVLMKVSVFEKRPRYFIPTWSIFEKCGVLCLSVSGVSRKRMLTTVRDIDEKAAQLYSHFSVQNPFLTISAMINSKQYQIREDEMILNISSQNREDEPFRLFNE
jgi:hypothetical protein